MQGVRRGAGASPEPAPGSLPAADVPLLGGASPDPSGPAQIQGDPKPILIGGAGLDGFVREHLQPELLVKALGDVCRCFTGASI